jgi:hypothetical protein
MHLPFEKSTRFYCVYFCCRFRSILALPFLLEIFLDEVARGIFLGAIHTYSR